MTNLDKLDQKICEMRLENEKREIELNKLEAYYWLKTNFNLDAENIKNIRYRKGQNKSFIEMRNDNENEQEFIEIEGHVHEILMGLDTSYKKKPIWQKEEHGK